MGSFRSIVSMMMLVAFLVAGISPTVHIATTPLEDIHAQLSLTHEEHHEEGDDQDHAIHHVFELTDRLGTTTIAAVAEPVKVAPSVHLFQQWAFVDALIEQGEHQAALGAVHPPPDNDPKPDSTRDLATVRLLI